MMYDLGLKEELPEMQLVEQEENKSETYKAYEKLNIKLDLILKRINDRKIKNK